MGSHSVTCHPTQVNLSTDLTGFSPCFKKLGLHAAYCGKLAAKAMTEVAGRQFQTDAAAVEKARSPMVACGGAWSNDDRSEMRWRSDFRM